MSVIIRIASVEGSPQIKEHFLGFLEAEETTGESLSALILKTLQELNILFVDCRGQSYDNGTNMKEKRKGVQARLLEINSRALFVPCGAHTVNLVVSDAAKSSVDATLATCRNCLHFFQRPLKDGPFKKKTRNHIFEILG